nr:esterase [uncultured bacterium]
MTRPGDGAALAGLHGQSFETPWDTAAFEALLIQQGVFGICHEDGFILCRTVLDEAEILTLAVNPTARRSGLGLRLVEAAAGLAARTGALRLFLEVAEDNPAARGLYARAGFKAEGRRKAYYARKDAPAVDALILSLNLAGRLPTG